MVLKLFFDISTSFWFSENLCEFSVHLCSCPCIREAKSLLYSYIYCALLEVAKKGVVTHLCSVACICGSNEGFVKLRTLGRWTQKQIESIFTLCKSTSFSTKTTNSKMFPQILPFLKFFEINYFEVKEICISQSIALAFRLIYKPL